MGHHSHNHLRSMRHKVKDRFYWIQEGWGSSLDFKVDTEFGVGVEVEAVHFSTQSGLGDRRELLGNSDAKDAVRCELGLGLGAGIELM